MVLTATIVGAILGLGAGRLSVPSYQASTTILIYQAPGALPDAEAVSQGQRVADTYAELLQQRPIMEQLAQNLDLDIDPDALKRKVNVTQVGNTNLLKLTVTDDDPQRAADIANEIVRIFVTENVEVQSGHYTESLDNLQTQMEQVQADIKDTEASLDELKSASATLTPQQTQQRSQLQALIAEYRNTYAILLDRYEQIRMTQTQAIDRISVVEEALPGKVVGSSSSFLILEGAIIGLVLAGGAALLIEYLSDTVKDSADVERLTGVSVLGMVGILPSKKDPGGALVTLNDPESPSTEAYRLLSVSLEHEISQNPVHVLVVTSCTPLEGKTTTTANLAVALARGGWKVIVIDMDLRRPSLHKVFQQPNKAGVSTVLRRPGNVADYLIPVADNLSLLPSGPSASDASSLLQQPRTVELIESLKKLADVILIDTPPVMVVADPVLVARLADAVVMVVKSNVTRFGVLRQVVDLVEKSGARLLGVVLNQVKSHRDGSHYYYDYSYYGTNAVKRKRGASDQGKAPGSAKDGDSRDVGSQCLDT
jgi:capsular exopolysaccharide synthesis family protein